MSFQWITVLVVLSIFALFFYGAHRADKVVEEIAAARREAQTKATKVKK